MYLEVSPKGGKWWRLKYRINGKEKRLSLGVYPEISLKDARERRTDAKRLLADDIDPSEYRKANKSRSLEQSKNSFEAIAREWYLKFLPTWVESHSARFLRGLEKDVFPWIGNKPIATITPPDLLSVIQRIEERGAVETAHRTLGKCGQIMRYAIATGRAERDISQDLRGDLPPVQGKHLAATTEPKKVGEMLRIMDGYEGTPVVRSALRLAPLVFVRPGELRHAEWDDFDFDEAEWRYTVTKTNTPHIVPLSRQAIEILEELKPLTSRSRYVFPGARSIKRPMSDNAILAAMRTMGIKKEEMSGHGFRAMARTILDEVLGFRPDFIEHQLAHAVRDPNGRAYNRTAHLPERKKMMQEWADYLDSLKDGAEVIKFKQRA
jgi:integrase